MLEKLALLERGAGAVRCEMRGELAADGWKHSPWWRCLNDAVYQSSGGTRFCAACAKHMREFRRAEIRLAERQLLAIKTAKRLR